MEVYKRPNSPFWYVTLTDAGGKRLRVSTKERDKRAAQKAAAKLASDQDAETELARDGKRPIKLREALRQYVDHLRLTGKRWAAAADLYARKTYGELDSAAGRWRIAGDPWLHDITPQILRDLTHARLREGNAAATIAHEIKVLRAASYLAGSLRYRTPDLDDWAVPTLPHKTRYLSWEEFELVLAQLDPARPVSMSRNGTPYSQPRGGVFGQQRQDAYDLAWALALCGGRWSEVTTLTWDRVDIEAGTIRLWGNKTKTERLAPMPAQLKAVLARRYADRKPGAKLVFPGRNGGERAGSSRAILRAMTAAGLNEPARAARDGKAVIHSLRHTFASWLIQNGADLAEVQDALGHTTPNMTRRYAHLSKAKTAAKLGGILDGLTPVTVAKDEARC